MRRAAVYVLVSALCGTTVLHSGCAANEAILKSNTASEPVQTSQPANTEPSESSYERDIEAMRTADFDYIFVLRRKDGAKMDADDRAVVRAVTEEANRRSLSDDGKAVIVGANYPIVADKMKTLGDRFAIEDLSKPPAERKPVGNASAPNANTTSNNTSTNTGTRTNTITTTNTKTAPTR